jgi:uncharacterized membrane protein
MKIKGYRQKLSTWFGRMGKLFLEKAGIFKTRLSPAVKLCLARVKEYRKIWPTHYREANELLLIVLLVLVLPLVILIAPSNVLRIVLGLPMVLFLPGYTLLAALYVRKGQLKNLDRLALSFAASIAVVPLIGLLINYMPGGIGLASFYLLIALFILVMSAIAWIRRGRLADGERFTVLLRWPRPAFGGGIFNKLPSIMVALAALALVASLIYVIVTPKTHEHFTEFYITGLPDASVYPAGLSAGDEQKVLVTVVNREGRSLEYLIEVSINRVKQARAGPLTLGDGQKFESEMGFTPQAVGAGQEVEFALYINGETEPYLEPLRLWFDVK